MLSLNIIDIPSGNYRSNSPLHSEQNFKGENTYSVIPILMGTKMFCFGGCFCLVVIFYKPCCHKY